MSRLLALDLETTGLDTAKDHVTEIGWVLVDTKEQKPLLAEGKLLKVEEGVILSDVIKDITHITDAMLAEFGEDPRVVYERLNQVIYTHKVDYIVAHNGSNFDKPMLISNMDRYGVPFASEIHWLDTRTDIQFKDHIKGRNLTYLCAEHGFVNPFPHAALFDAMATMALLRKYDEEAVIAYSKEPNIVVRAVVTFEEKDKAKEKMFGWQEAGGKHFKKQWVKQIKENQFEEFKASCDFQMAIVG